MSTDNPRFKVVYPTKPQRIIPSEVLEMAEFLAKHDGQWIGDGQRYPTQEKARTFAQTYRNRLARALRTPVANVASITWQAEDGYWYIGLRRKGIGG